MATVRRKEEVGPEGASGVRGIQGGSSEKTSEKTSEKNLAAFSRDPEVTIADLARLVGVTARSIEGNLQRLQQQGRLRRIGPDKGAHWEVLNVPGLQRDQDPSGLTC